MFYTVGLVFYALTQRVRIGHGIWHLFVLAGSLSHYFAIFYYVA
jgi:hemolysin III